MQRKDYIDAPGALALIVFSSLMGLNQVLVKLVNAGMHPVFQAGARSLCAFIPVLLWAWLRKKPLNIRDGSLGPGMLAGLFFSGEFVLLFTALEYTSVSRASVFFYTMPLWTALGAHWLIPGERLTVLRVTGLFVAITGVVLALSRNNAPVSDLAFVGDIMCLLGAMLWAGIALLARTTALSKSCPEMALLYQLGVSAPILLAAAPLLGEPIREMTPLIGGIFAFQVIVVVAFGFALWFWALSIYPAGSMTSFSFLAPVFGVFFGWALLNEVISPVIVIALILVSLGVVLVNRKPG
ncbi:MAG: DMT family transporter [Burkholderiaceae bacterium]